MEALTIHIVHKLPGRLRVRLSVAPADIEAFTRKISNHDGFHRIVFNPISRSVLFTYETGHLTTEEIVLRAAVTLSLQYSSAPVRVFSDSGEDVMTDGAILSGVMLLVVGFARWTGSSASKRWLELLAGTGVALAVLEHGWREIREEGMVHPELLSIGYLLTSFIRKTPLRGATVTWIASFARHLLFEGKKCIEVLPEDAKDSHQETVTCRVAQIPALPPQSPLLRFVRDLLQFTGFAGVAGTGSSLFDELKHVYQVHGEALEGFDQQHNGKIPLIFR